MYGRDAVLELTGTYLQRFGDKYLKDLYIR